MFSTGTQRKFWNFPTEEELENLRREAFERFVKEHTQNVAVCLSLIEESIIRKAYEEKLRDFCMKFQPPMPNSAVGTAMIFFKRLFLHHSVMELPIEDYMHVCIFMACKIDEFNITPRQYVDNLGIVGRDLDDVAQQIVSNELQLMEKLHFHLTVHTPYRQVEGLIIDIKTRCSENIDAEKLRPGISSFLHRSLLSDALLLYPPSQIALTAILASATNLGMNVAVDSFIANKLLASGSYELRRNLAAQLQKIRHLVRKVQDVNEDEFTAANSKVELCYKTFNMIPKCWRWRVNGTSQESDRDVSMSEAGNFDDDEDE